MDKQSIQSQEDIMAEAEEARRTFRKRVLAGKATWGAWRYNPDKLTLEINSKISGYPKNNPYCVYLERCNSSDDIVDWLLQLLGKQWCPKEQVGYLLQAIHDLSDDLYRVIGNRHFNLVKHLRDMRTEGTEKLLTVNEVAAMLSVNKMTVYRWIEKGKIEVIRLPGGRGRGGIGEIRIPEKEVGKLRTK